MWADLIKGLIEVAGGVIAEVSRPFAEKDPKNEDAKRAVQAGEAIQRLVRGSGGAGGGGLDLSKLIGTIGGAGKGTP